MRPEVSQNCRIRGLKVAPEPTDPPLRGQSQHPPSYRRHKPSGQAVVTLDGHDIYLGTWDTKADRTECDRVLGEWPVADRRLPTAATDITVADLVTGYLKFAKSYYRKDGRPSTHLHAIQ